MDFGENKSFQRVIEDLYYELVPQMPGVTAEECISSSAGKRPQSPFAPTALRPLAPRS
jgi:hypothetical protein